MAECNAAKTLDNAVLEGYDTDVMTGDRDKRRYLYYQLIHSMRKADRIDIIDQCKFRIRPGIHGCRKPGRCRTVSGRGRY